jgi:hypothetical protein
MRSRILWAGGIAAIAVGTWFTWQVGRGQISGERGTLLDRQSTRRSALATARRYRGERPELDTAMQSMVDRTLGPDMQTVDPALRHRLDTAARAAGLDAVSVGTSMPAAKATPARSAFRRHKALRDEVDFYEVSATVSGDGTIDQALGLIDRVQSEPWLMRVDQVKLDPKKEGERLRVSIALTTVFVPGGEPGPDAPPSAYDAIDFERFGAMVAASPFRLPVAAPSPPPPPAVDPAPDPGPPPFPWDRWYVTAVVRGPRGWEVWLRNGESERRLAIGERVGEAEFVDAAGDLAEFRLGDERFEVRVGSKMSDRAPVSR